MAIDTSAGVADAIAAAWRTSWVPFGADDDGSPEYLAGLYPKDGDMAEEFVRRIRSWDTFNTMKLLEEFEGKQRKPERKLKLRRRNRNG